MRRTLWRWELTELESRETQNSRSASPQNQCKQTIRSRINAVESSDHIPSVWDVSLRARWLHAKTKKKDNEPAGDVTHQQQYGGTVAVTQATCHPDISLRVKGSQIYSTPIRWPWRDLFRSANVGTDMRVICGGLQANFTICMKGELCGLLCPTERQPAALPPCWISISLRTLWVFLILRNPVINMPRTPRHAATKEGGSFLRTKSTFENGAQRRGVEALWFATIWGALLSNATTAAALCNTLRNAAALRPGWGARLSSQC